MSKKNNKALLFIAGLALLIGGAYGVSQAVDSPNNNGIILTPGDESSDIALNATSIKMKNIGDTFTLSASVNADATVKSVTFTSSDPEAVSVTKVNSTSVKLTKLKYFTNHVVITAISDDPFVDLSATCSIRSYNSFTSFETINFTKIQDDSGTSYSTMLDQYYEDEIILKQGLTYSFNAFISTQFSYLNDEQYEGYDDTYINIEDEDMEGLKSAFENAFGNSMISFSQNLNEIGYNQISATFKYENEIEMSLSSGGYYSNIIKYNSKQKTIRCYPYVAAEALNFNQSGTIVL